MATKDMKIKKAVLAYSGGLDTSVLIPWLKENYGCEVVAVSGDVGQGTELDGLEEKALKTGASKLYVMDLTKEFVDDYIIPTMKADADYEGYLLGTSFARPIIAKRIVEKAPEGMTRVFFCNGGADSNENAIKMARLATGKGKVLSMYRSYHGATITAGNVSGDGRRFSAEIGGNAPGVIHFFGPFPYREEINFASEADETKYYLQMLEKTIIAEGHDKIAADMEKNESLRNTVEILMKKISPQ